MFTIGDVMRVRTLRWIPVSDLMSCDKLRRNHGLGSIDFHQTKRTNNTYPAAEEEIWRQGIFIYKRKTPVLSRTAQG